MIREGETPITLKVKTKKEIIDVYLYSLNVIDRQTISN